MSAKVYYVVGQTEGKMEGLFGVDKQRLIF